MWSCCQSLLQFNGLFALIYPPWALTCFQLVFHLAPALVGAAILRNDLNNFTAERFAQLTGILSVLEASACQTLFFCDLWTHKASACFHLCILSGYPTGLSGFLCSCLTTRQRIRHSVLATRSWCRLAGTNMKRGFVRPLEANRTSCAQADVLVRFSAKLAELSPFPVGSSFISFDWSLSLFVHSSLRL